MNKRTHIPEVDLILQRLETCDPPRGPSHDTLRSLETLFSSLDRNSFVIKLSQKF